MFCLQQIVLILKINCGEVMQKFPLPDILVFMSFYLTVIIIN